MNRVSVYLLLLAACGGLALTSCNSPTPAGMDAEPTSDSLQPSVQKVRPSDYKRELWKWRRQALLDENGKIAGGAALKARNQVEAMRQIESTGSNGFHIDAWRAGPANFAGRMRALDIDPRDPNIMISGAASGGLWRTKNGGDSWVPVGDMMPSLAIADIVRSSTTPDVLVAGTGELFLENGPGGIPFGGAGEAVQGAGIYRSTDNGLTWTVTAAAPIEVFHMDISATSTAVPTEVILATSETGIWRSTDLGLNWANVSAWGVEDISFHPTDPLRVVAAGTLVPVNRQLWGVHPTTQNVRCAIAVPATNNCPPGTVIQVPHFEAVLWRSNDGGLSWNRNNATTDLIYRDAIAFGCTSQGPALRYCPQQAPGRWEIEYHNNSTVYAVNDISQVFRSLDDGLSWYQVGTAPVGDQGWYDLALWVDRSDTDNIVANDLLVVGGMTLRRSVNGGASFTQISDDLFAGSAHDDHHLILEHPGLLLGQNRTVFVATDGGVYRADNIDTAAIDTWVARNNGMATTQFYGAATHDVTRRTVGGTQDQGGLRTENFAPFTEIFDPGFGGTLGDAGFSAIDQEDPMFTWVTGTNLVVFQSTDGGLTVTEVGPPTMEFSNFFAPMILHPDDRDRLYVGGQSLWRSDNPRAANPTWSVAKTNLGGFGSNPIAAVAASQPDAINDVIWVAHNSQTPGGGSGVFFTTTGGGVNGTAWTEDNAFPRPGRLPMRITIDPDDPMHVFVCFGGFAPDNLWERTIVGGAVVWQSITLPVNAPVRDFALDRVDPNGFILATQVGLFVSPDRGVTWRIISPANISIEEIYWSRGHLFVATHGRGLFSQTPYGASSQKGVGISCNINGTPTPGPVIASGAPELGLGVPVEVQNGTPGALVFMTLGFPPSAPVPACGPQAINAIILPGPPTLDTNGRADFSIALPDNPVFVGIRLIVQAAEIAGGAIVISNGIHWTVGY